MSFSLKWLTHRVISDRVHRLLVTLSFFRLDGSVQLLSLIPILILLLYLFNFISKVFRVGRPKMDFLKSGQGGPLGREGSNP